jgi:hypothetical protein
LDGCELKIKEEYENERRHQSLSPGKDDTFE